jgi:hypothetical protein
MLGVGGSERDPVEADERRRAKEQNQLSVRVGLSITTHNSV